MYGGVKKSYQRFSCVCIAWYKHWSSSRVCVTVENSPNPSRVYIRLCKQGNRFLLLIISINNAVSRCWTVQFHLALTYFTNYKPINLWDKGLQGSPYTITSSLWFESIWAVYSYTKIIRNCLCKPKYAKISAIRMTQ